MATSNSKPTQILLPTTFITVFLLLLCKVNSSDYLSFTFDKFEPKQNGLLLQGDASITSAGVLQLSKVENGRPAPFSVARALFAYPVNIWDSSSNKVASFVTSFSFIINAPNAPQIADGLTFFIARDDSKIPPNSSGGYFGLINNQTSDSKSNQIVAVEFDTYSNPWDPKGRHIGIDVNSVTSKNVVAWDWRNGEVANVVIKYVASSQTLTATLTYPSDNKSYSVSSSVDVKAILPEWVKVGFSGATGLDPNIVQTNNVLSWSFTSDFTAKKVAAIESNEDIIIERYGV